MKSINLSNSELKVSPLALGMWRIHNISKSELNTLLDTALSNGITTFDHADIYGDYTCEEQFSSWMKDNQKNRTQIQLISKCGIKLVSGNRPAHHLKHYDTSYAHIKHSVENSLKALGTEYLDLLLIHRPDPLMKSDEVARAFEELKLEGKVRHFGVSNFSTRQFDLLAAACDMPLVTNQIEISLFHPDAMFNGMLDHLQLKGINPMAWSPLGGANNINEAVNNPKLQRIAAKNDITIGDLLLAWLLKHPSGILPVIGTMNPSRIESVVKTMGIQISDQDWFEMLEIARGHEVA